MNLLKTQNAYVDAVFFNGGVNAGKKALKKCEKNAKKA